MMALPPDFISRMRMILMPFIATKEEREAMIIEAFFRYDPILSRVDYDGAPRVFCTRFINQLIDHCITAEQHALARLLESVRDDCGSNKQSEIDDLIRISNDLCVTEKPKPAVPLPPVDGAEGVQSTATPRDERTPTVFISYSHHDEAFAKQLIADLNAAGHACWIDTSEIKGGDEWIITIAEGIINSYAFVPILSRKAIHSTWVRKEILWAVDRKRRVIPLFLENIFDHPFMLLLKDVQGITLFESNYADSLNKLLSYLPAPKLPDIAVDRDDEPITPLTVTATAPNRRKLELAYMERLRLEELLNTEKYTAMGGTAQVQRRPEMRAVFELLRMGRGEMQQETRRFENAVEEIQAIRRCVLLGEPGGGKTTTLWKLASDLLEAALRDKTAPIPILIRLGKWTDAAQSLSDFIAAQMGDLGAHLDTLLSEKRAAILLDGLNELPANQHKAKYPLVQAFVEENPDLLAVVSCRELDYYTLELSFDKVKITPLDPLRIREFAGRYLGEAKGNDLFWKLAGERAANWYERFTKDVAQKLENPEYSFWIEPQLPEGIRWGWWADNNSYWHEWKKERENPSGLMILARNPYMLLMLTSVYAEEGELPANRGQLFAKFVETLLEREEVPEPERDPLVEGLAKVAYEMQIRRAEVEDGSNALTVLPETAVLAILGERLLYLAGSTSILSIGEQVRFTHQLLQEYFAAKYMDMEINAGRLKADRIWQPEKWWERTNWEEAAILLAGLYSDDCSDVLQWIEAANPEVVAQCVVKSGAHTPDETLLEFRNRWIPRLTDLKNDSVPQARVAVGRALGQLTLSDHGSLDNRQGIGVIVWDGMKLPDIDWVTIPAGEFIYGDDNKDDYPDYAKPADRQIMTLPTFQISRYPVTYAQFQAFLNDVGNDYDRWFDGLAADDDDKHMADQYFKYANHPRETVNWYQAMAFCRWFSAKLGGETDLDKVAQWAVHLPTEFEWEKAARGTDGRIYPWGDKYEIGYANIDEKSQFGSVKDGQYSLGQTSVVGMYPQGASPYGVVDMSGNVWEWCLTDYNNPALLAEKENIRSNARRVLRGGSWGGNSHVARAAYRFFSVEPDRDNDVGFRIVRPLRVMT